MVAAWSAAWLAVRSMITPLPGKTIGLVAYPSHTADNHVLRPLLPKPDRVLLGPARTENGAGRGCLPVVCGCPLGTDHDAVNGTVVAWPADNLGMPVAAGSTLTIG
jgi:hypothetical protein